MLKTILICDVETTGLDREKDHVIELGYVLWSVEHRTILEVYSGLLPCALNDAEAVNGIPASALQGLGAKETKHVWERFALAAGAAEAIVAHQADFDRAFCERYERTTKPWICTREDVKWPRAGTGTSLIATALAHGVAVVAAHRAINDCLMLARLLEVVPDSGDRLQAGLAHALLPKVRLVSLAPYEERETVKANGFKWDPQRHEWWRTLAEADAAELPFRTMKQENGT